MEEEQEARGEMNPTLVPSWIGGSQPAHSSGEAIIATHYLAVIITLG